MRITKSVRHFSKARSVRHFLWMLLMTVLIGVAAGALWHARQPTRRASTLPVYGAVPPFRLVDQYHRAVVLADLRGAPWIADFIFTRCAGQCPMMTARLLALTRRLPPEAPVRFVSFSVDPDYDTPEVLAAYARSQGATDPRWRWITGPREEVFRLSREGFHLAAEPTGGTEEEPIIHSIRLVLVDGEGRIRGYYDGTEAAVVDRLVRNVQTLQR